MQSLFGISASHRRIWSKATNSVAMCQAAGSLKKARVDHQAMLDQMAGALEAYKPLKATWDAAEARVAHLEGLAEGVRVALKVCEATTSKSKLLDAKAFAESEDGIESWTHSSISVDWLSTCTKALAHTTYRRLCIEREATASLEGIINDHRKATDVAFEAALSVERLEAALQALADRPLAVPMGDLELKNSRGVAGAVNSGAADDKLVNLTLKRRRRARPVQRL